MTLNQAERAVLQSVLMNRQRALKDLLASMEKSDRRRVEVKENLADYRAEAMTIEGLIEQIEQD